VADGIHPRLLAALREQLGRRPPGARRIGWKLGGHIAEIEAVTGGLPAFGHLTTATLLADGDVYDPGGAALHADTEVAVEIGADGEITAATVALELVDLSRPPDDLEGIVAANVFHVAFALGPMKPPPGVARARSVVNDEIVAEGSTHDVDEVVAVVRQLVEAAGERLEPGDVILTGSVTQVPLRPGDHISAEIDGLDRVGVQLRP
jgi:2-oxo-3-hexenedioate decarboxylase